MASLAELAALAAAPKQQPQGSLLSLMGMFGRQADASQVMPRDQMLPMFQPGAQSFSSSVPGMQASQNVEDTRGAFGRMPVTMQDRLMGAWRNAGTAMNKQDAYWTARPSRVQF